MFSMCSELTPRARIPDTRITQLMQPCWARIVYKMYSLDKTFVRKCKTQIGAKTHIKCSSIQTAGRLIFFTKLFSILKKHQPIAVGHERTKLKICFFVPECLSCGMNFNLKHYRLCDHQFGMCT